MAAHASRDPETRRSSTGSVNRFVNRTLRNRLRRGRRRRTAATMHHRTPRSARTQETGQDGRDARRMAHNPEFVGSNPTPATTSEAGSE
jgi:hypothetical protein